MRKIWNELPKTVKVFFYIFASYTLKFIAVRLGLIEDSVLADYLVGLINLAIVFLEESVPAIKRKILKK